MFMKCSLVAASQAGMVRHLLLLPPPRRSRRVLRWYSFKIVRQPKRRVQLVRRPMSQIRKGSIKGLGWVSSLARNIMRGDGSRFSRAVSVNCFPPVVGHAYTDQREGFDLAGADR